MNRLPGLVLVAALAIAALVRPLRLPLAAILLVAYVASGRRGARSAVLAAGLPVAAILAWGALGQPAAAADAAQCTDLLAPPAVWRLLEAVVGLAVLGALLLERRSSIADLGLRLGARRIALLAGIGALVVAPAAQDSTIEGAPSAAIPTIRQPGAACRSQAPIPTMRAPLPRGM